MRLENKTLDKLLADPRVESVDDMGESKSSHTLTLKAGFIDSESSMHLMTGTPSTFKRRMKYVTPCHCRQCGGGK